MRALWAGAAGGARAGPQARASPGGRRREVVSRFGHSGALMAQVRHFSHHFVLVCARTSAISGGGLSPAENDPSKRPNLGKRTAEITARGEQPTLCGRDVSRRCTNSLITARSGAQRPATAPSLGGVQGPGRIDLYRTEPGSIRPGPRLIRKPRHQFPRRPLSCCYHSDRLVSGACRSQKSHQKSQERRRPRVMLSTSSSVTSRTVSSLPRPGGYAGTFSTSTCVMRRRPPGAPTSRWRT